MQIFVISNGTYTKYYSNTTRNSHIKELSKNSGKNAKKTSNSFEFTSWWADANNKTITDLEGFTATFFAKHTILNVLFKYCVFTSDRIPACDAPIPDCSHRAHLEQDSDIIQLQGLRLNQGWRLHLAHDEAQARP